MLTTESSLFHAPSGEAGYRRPPRLPLQHACLAAPSAARHVHKTEIGCKGCTLGIVHRECVTCIGVHNLPHLQPKGLCLPLKDRIADLGYLLGIGRLLVLGRDLGRLADNGPRLACGDFLRARSGRATRPRPAA